MINHSLFTAALAAIVLSGGFALADTKKPIVIPPPGSQTDQQPAQEKAKKQPDSGTADSALGQKQSVPAQKLKRKDQSNVGDATDQTKKKKKQANAGAAASDQPTDANAKKKTDKMAAGSKGDIKITPERKQIIRQKIVTRNITRINRKEIHFKILVGIAIPRTIELYPLPPSVIEVVPAYEGYLYFVLDDGTIVIVDPDTMQIVYMLA